MAIAPTYVAPVAEQVPQMASSTVCARLNASSRGRRVNVAAAISKVLAWACVTLAPTRAAVYVALVASLALAV